MNQPRETNLLRLYATIKRLHARSYTAIKGIKAAVPTHATTKAVADAALITRKACELLADLQKQLDDLNETISATGVMMLIAKGTGEPLAGDYCTAYGKPGVSASVPSFSKDPAKYQRLCEVLRVEFNPLTRLHWPSIKQQLSELVEAGHELPAEIKEFQTYPETKLIAKERGGNLLDIAAAQVQGILGENQNDSVSAA